MSLNLLNATRKISHREPNTPITKHQLFNMLVDYGAFKDSTILKFAVKNIITEGFWTKAAKIFNIKYGEQGYDPNAIQRLKTQISLTFGYPDVIIDIILDSIWNTDEWDKKWDPKDPGLCLHFEGIPITGRTYDFVNKLIELNFSWDIYKRCLVGRFHGVENCEIKCNISDSEVPLYLLDIKLPMYINESQATSLVSELKAIEVNRLSNHVGKSYTNSDTKLSSIALCRNKNDGCLIIRYTDGIGQGIMIESFLYNPHNNLATID